MFRQRFIFRIALGAGHEHKLDAAAMLLKVKVSERRQTDRQTDRQTHTHTHTQTHRQTHTHTHRQTDRDRERVKVMHRHELNS